MIFSRQNYDNSRRLRDKLSHSGKQQGVPDEEGLNPDRCLDLRRVWVELADSTRHRTGLRCLELHVGLDECEWRRMRRWATRVGRWHRRPRNSLRQSIRKFAHRDIPVLFQVGQRATGKEQQEPAPSR